VAGYDNAIVFLDSHVQRVFREFGWDKNTIVIFTADHGEELGDHGNWGHAHNLYAETLNVPLVLFGLPGVRTGQRLYERVSHVDVLPTLRAVAGAPPATADSGVSLLPLLRGEPGGLPQRALYADLWRSPQGQRTPYLQATLFGPWKFIQGMEEGPLLFNLDADPLDLHNQFSANAALGAELRQRFVDFATASRHFEPEFEEAVQDEAMNEELRALGYVN
jgi:choline-sulfatase